MSVHGGAVHLTSKYENFDSTFLAFLHTKKEALAKFTKSTAGPFKSSAGFRNEQYRLYSIKT